VDTLRGAEYPEVPPGARKRSMRQAAWIRCHKHPIRLVRAFQRQRGEVLGTDVCAPDMTLPRGSRAPVGTGQGGNHCEHCSLDREEASRRCARWMTGSSQPPPPTTLGAPCGKGVPSVNAEARPSL